jgi:CheY-like chemotaxis protein
MNDTLDQALNRAHSDVVLIVDDVPDNVSLLHDALDESGCTVLVALDGEPRPAARRPGAPRHRAA